MRCRAGTVANFELGTVPALRSGMAAMQGHRLTRRTASGTRCQ
ncbi:MAG: hypothetical protein JWR89_4767 [Tardiphaga sp.]|nr:hypothetical protein [Tardiphaga sp.]